MSGLCSSLIGSALCQPVDIYCERTSTALFAEPLNAISNLAFIIAGWMAAEEFRRSGHSRDDTLLIAIIVLLPIVGVGSLLFHTLATRWASWADVIPILIFMLLYLWLALRRYLGWQRGLTLIALVVFLLSTLALETMVPEQVLWGGAMYLPTVAACLVIVLAPMQAERRVRRTIALAVGMFLLGFTLRSLDAPLCTSLPIGTHYFWHVSNAIVLYLLVRAAILHGAPARERELRSA
uniref:Ceramidase n=1 Tax=uncultured bacterium 12AC_lac13 TaxID=1447233 RepID=X2L7G5_9BACT|nr:hypothetical protein [uncultured bacterium 12AC_lac13]